MSLEAMKFQAEVEQFFSDVGVWNGLTPQGKELVQGLGAKLEPFCVLLDTGIFDHKGFELLAYGPNGEHYGQLTKMAKDFGLQQEILDVALFRVGLLTANELAQKAKDNGIQLSRFIFSLNVNKELLKAPHVDALHKILERLQRPAFNVLIEASEEFDTLKDAELLLDFVGIDKHEWLNIALDDANKFRFEIRGELEKRVKMVKIDRDYVTRHHEQCKREQKGAEYLCEKLLDIHRPIAKRERVPLVVEGIEDSRMAKNFRAAWSDEYGELWMQGYHIQVPKNWATLVEPISGDHATPKGYVLPQTAEGKARSGSTGFSGKTNPPKNDSASNPGSGKGSVYVGRDNNGNINTGRQTHINTGGGSYIIGGVKMGSGDFVGRDKITR